MNEACKNTVVILGAGATIGSGYTRCGKNLPGDRGFFERPAVRTLLSQCPALEIMLKIFRHECGQDLRGVSLEEVWTFLEFSVKGVYRKRKLANLAQEQEDWLAQIRDPASIDDDEHWYCKHFRQDRTLPSEKIDMTLLAGWDLRRLLYRVFQEVQAPDAPNVYQRLLKRYGVPRDGTTAFISFNYDTILEHALSQPDPCPWFYVHIPTTVQRELNGVRVFKPHGSLNWLFEGNEPSVEISADYHLEPVGHQSLEVNRFKESMIILPTQLKQVLNFKKTQARKTTKLFGKIRQGMADALAEADRVFVIGYSFPSTDHHFRTLIRWVNHRRQYKKYAHVYCCVGPAIDTLKRPDCEEDGREQVFANARRFFPAVSFHPHGQGFEAFVK
jgi:hypothetical protein